jgi:hypothetical protein
LKYFASTAFDIDESFIHGDLQDEFEIVKRSSIPLNCLVIKSVMTTIFISDERQNEYNSGFRAFSSYELRPEQHIGFVHFPDEWRQKMGNSLQIIITGSYFYGPDSRWPDRTDEMDPMIDCLVVEHVNDDEMERLATFSTRFSHVRKLEWSTVVKVLR